MKKYLTFSSNFIYRILNDTRFFIFSIVLFAIHCSWLALSAYTLPFDEYFHLGIIKFYSHQVSPFISSQPPEVSYLGDLTRLPSYLYGYLMSFPYRLFSTFTDNPYVLTVLMRSINIVIVIIGLILWRKLLLKIGVSRRIAHLALFVFMMLPLVVLVAAENNYDNLMFVLAAVFFSLAFDIARGTLRIKHIIGYISLGLVACLVKNQFLVIFGLTTILISVIVLKRYGFKSSIQKLYLSIISTSWPVLFALAILLVISAGLFAERYGVNFVRYHSINLDCAKVQPFEVCYQNSPWQRNFNTIRDKSPDLLFGNPASFTIHWITAMMRGFVANFANVLSNAKPWDPYGSYEFKPLMPLMIISGYIALVTGFISLIVNIKKWWQIDWMRYTFLLASCYIFILWSFNYSSYLKTGQAYAIQPRYLYPLLILILAFTAKLILMLFKNRQLAGWTAGLVILIYIYSGGVIGWFLYANSNWYWPSQSVINVNQNIKPVLQHTVLHANLE